MANSPNIRIPLEDHEEAEKLALLKSAETQKLTTKNAIIKEAVKIGLGILRDNYGRNKKKTRSNKD